MEQFNDNLKCLKENYELVGRDEEAQEILYRIASGSMLLIKGDQGSGKTSLLKYAVENFRGKGKVIYINIKTFGKRLDVAKLLPPKAKGMILLVDNAHYLSEENNKKIKYFYDQDQIKSAVFTTTIGEELNFTDAIKSRIGRNIITLKPLKKAAAIEAARERLRDKTTIPEEILGEIYERTENIKELIMACDALCDYLEKEEKETAEVEDLDKIEIEEPEELAAENCRECNKTLTKIGKYWRCRNCDTFCENCGALHNKKDTTCPSCETKLEENRK